MGLWRGFCRGAQQDWCQLNAGSSSAGWDLGGIAADVGLLEMARKSSRMEMPTMESPDAVILDFCSPTILSLFDPGLGHHPHRYRADLSADVALATIWGWFPTHLLIAAGRESAPCPPPGGPHLFGSELQNPTHGDPFASPHSSPLPAMAMGSGAPGGLALISWPTLIWHSDVRAVAVSRIWSLSKLMVLILPSAPCQHPASSALRAQRRRKMAFHPDSAESLLPQAAPPMGFPICLLIFGCRSKKCSSGAATCVQPHCHRRLT